MSTLSLRIPKSMHEKMRELAKKEGVSMNQLISSAISEKLSALLTEEYLMERGKLGSREKFDQVLSKVPDVAPKKGDEL